MSDTFAVSLSQLERFRFLVDFNQDGVPDLVTDELIPLGESTGPNPARLLAAAVGNCLSASLLFCLNKSHVDVSDIKCVVEGDIERNEKGRLRIAELRVRIEPGIGTADLERIGRCVNIFEDFCIVTESVRSGIDVLVEIAPTPIERSEVVAV